MPDELTSVTQVDIDREKVKRAVKEALDDKRMEDIAAQLTALANQMTKGFAEVHTRQDQANGKLMSHQTMIADIQSKSSYDKVIWLIVTALIGVVTYFLTKGT